MAARSSCSSRCRRAISRVMVDRLTLKVAATSALGIPRAAAATMRCRRSMEYALIFHSMPQPSMFLPAAVGRLFHCSRCPNLIAMVSDASTSVTRRQILRSMMHFFRVNL